MAAYIETYVNPIEVAGQGEALVGAEEAVEVLGMKCRRVNNQMATRLILKCSPFYHLAVGWLYTLKHHVDVWFMITQQP
jgi:hypothetical protein